MTCRTARGTTVPANTNDEARRSVGLGPDVVRPVAECRHPDALADMAGRLRVCRHCGCTLSMVMVCQSAVTVEVEP